MAGQSEGKNDGVCMKLLTQDLALRRNSFLSQLLLAAILLDLLTPNGTKFITQW